jgi:hypothetical protein
MTRWCLWAQTVTRVTTFDVGRGEGQRVADNKTLKTAALRLGKLVCLYTTLKGCIARQLGYIFFKVILEILCCQWALKLVCGMVA